MLAIVLVVMLQQAAPASDQVVWEMPAAEPVVAATPLEIPTIPESARADPYGYERAQCSPLMRKADESLEACQSRVRVALAANLGAALPPGLAPVGSPDNCRQEAAGNRYALQCGSPTRAAPTGPVLRDRVCTTRPSVTGEGGVSFREECTDGGEHERDEGLKIRLGGED